MDAKSLLRAKKASARIEHPYAAYSAAGVLRCSVCSVPVKQWDAHLLTKQHRQAVAREKEQAAKAERAKRKAEGSSAGGSAAKRAKAAPAAVDEEDGGSAGAALPAGFFDAGRAPAVQDEDDEDEDDASGPSASAPPAPTGDAELDDFLASLDAEPTPTPAAPTKGTSAAAVAAARRRPAYKDVGEGVATYSAAPQLISPAENGAEKAGAEEDKSPSPPPETEAERRARLEREEREEIMARLEEEERAQEDADSRVTALKARMEALKRKREAKAGGVVNGGRGKAKAPAEKK